MAQIRIKGIYRDVFSDAQERIFFDSGWNPNLIASSCRVFMAEFMKGEADLVQSGKNTFGIQSLKIGTGDPAWDTNPVLPDPSIETLRDGSPHIIDRADLKLRYLDAGGQESLTAATSRLEIVATLGPNQPPPKGTATTYPLREFGLFGKLGGKEYMIDYIRHPLIEKDMTVTLERRIQLFF